MAKCAVCNNKMKILEQNMSVKNGKICESCCEKVGINAGKLGFKNIGIAMDLVNVDMVKRAIDNDEKLDLSQIKAIDKKKKQEKKQQQAKLKNEEDNKRKTEENSKLNKIKKQFEEAGVSDLFGTHKEVKSLPEVLEDNEKILYATSGFINSQTVLIVLTQKRILFINRGMLYGTQNREIPLNKVNEVSYDKGIMFGKITIINGAVSTTIDNVNKETAGIFAKKTRNAINDLDNSNSSNNNSVSAADEIIKFKSLLDQGIITEEEFEAKKKQLLNL